MKFFLLFLMTCFFSGMLFNRWSIRRLTLLVVGISLVVTFSYFFLNVI